jgi:signal transduction histidine kinase
MVGLEESERTGADERLREPTLGKFYVVILGAALLVSPSLHLVERFARRNFGSVPVVGLLGALALLVLLRVAGTVRESERLRLEVAAQNQRLLQLDRMKDEFVASVSHELRTPLTSINGYVELLRDDETLDAEQEKMLEIVDRNAARLLRVVSDLLFFAQGDDAELPGESSDVDLMKLAHDAVEAARPRASTGEVTVQLHGGPARLHGDPMRLAQVIDNLLSNAIKFTPGGGQVDVLVARRGERALLSVSDTGMGIPEGEQADLFQRFFRTRGANDAAIQGTGLGLSIAKQIVEGHGGTIGFTSREGRGTTFTVELPVAPASALGRDAELALSR